MLQYKENDMKIMDTFDHNLENIHFYIIYIISMNIILLEITKEMQFDKMELKQHPC